MGCDIHTYVEKKEGNHWNALKGKNRFFGKWEDEEEFTISNWIYDGRNYELFALLAGVRNTYKVTPISKPKGVPNDLSNSIMKDYEEWGVDAHSASYYTFEELLNFDGKNKYIEVEGFVGEKGYKTFKEKGEPDSYCGNVHGPDVEKVLNCEMERVIKNKYPWEQKTMFYTALKWKVLYSEILEYLLKNIEKYIAEQHIEKEDYKNYRMVFWFDN